MNDLLSSTPTYRINKVVVHRRSTLTPKMSTDDLSSTPSYHIIMGGASEAKTTNSTLLRSQQFVGARRALNVARTALCKKSNRCQDVE